MAKRVKKGFRIELPGNQRRAACVAHESGGLLFISPVTNSSFEWSFSAEQCEALGITAALEDVPEPWERLRDALLQASAELGRTDSHPVYQLRHVELQRAAELLGIEPEGASSRRESRDRA